MLTRVVPQAVDPIDTYASCITWQTESSFGSQHALKRCAHAKLSFGGKTILDPVSGSVWSFLDLLQSIVINVHVSHSSPLSRGMNEDLFSSYGEEVTPVLNTHTHTDVRKTNHN